MARLARGPETSAEWIVRATAWDFELSATRPFDARILTQSELPSERVGIHDGFEVGMLLTGGIEVGLHKPPQPR